MFIDARTLESGTTVEADVCIVGGGAAGLATALELAGGPLSAVVLESGDGAAPGRPPVGKTRGHLLAAGDGYLEATGERAFGGLGEDWHGSCRPLDPEDLAARDWVAASGWPLAPAALAPWIARAAALLDVDLATGAAPPPAVGEGFASSWLAYAPRPSIASLFRPTLAAAADVRVLTSASVTGLELDPATGRVAAAAARCLDGPELAARARLFVLAAGALGNPRLLLASRGQRPRGLGNEHDLVGRYFAEQIVMPAGHAVLPGRAGAVRPYREIGPHPKSGRPVRAVLRPPGELQERHELLNSLVMLAPAGATAAGELAGDVARLAASARVPAAGGDPGEPVELTAVTLRGEQTPNPASRVVLARRSDPLGVPLVDLTWKVSPHDTWSLRSAARLFGESLGRARDGRLRLPDLARITSREYRWAGHQSGTTRMSEHPEHGVVDPDCRVHDVANLYVAGSSVFPTGGCSDPMLTALALALRLGAHLRSAAAGSPRA
ncbi:MAG: FAD-dependent oxidoreductase [Acidobacteriota bacterium]|nr:FAD-dependent oxidoreductase [Acidobacteriota bacterium]MDH3523621.1 FAD-dependent oxidoreductase [Acidobacteriota bacterium]